MTTKTIDWTEIDPWLKQITSKGTLAFLQKRFGVSKWALHFRRKELGLPALPKGRPLEKDFTERELAVKRLLDEGYMQSKIAQKLSLSVASVENAAVKIRQKEKLQALHCKTCDGLGVVTCSTCDTKPRPHVSHFHVCPDCKGDSVASR